VSVSRFRSSPPPPPLEEIKSTYDKLSVHVQGLTLLSRADTQTHTNSLPFYLLLLLLLLLLLIDEDVWKCRPGFEMVLKRRKTS
jgi:hypothetical protein